MAWKLEKKFFLLHDLYIETGAELSELTKGVLAYQNIDESKCVSDSTDGASNISGQYKGFTAFLKKESPAHIYTWCYYANVVNSCSVMLLQLITHLYLYLDYFNKLRYSFVNHICKWICEKNK